MLGELRIGFGLMIIRIERLAVEKFASVARTMKSLVPLVVGVPEIMPLLAKLNSAGTGNELGASA